MKYTGKYGRPDLMKKASELLENKNMRKIAVFAKTHEEFIHYVSLDPKPSRLFAHIKNPVDCEGVEFRRLVLLAGYDQVPNTQHLLNLATLKLRE